MPHDYYVDPYKTNEVDIVTVSEDPNLYFRIIQSFNTGISVATAALRQINPLVWPNPPLYRGFCQFGFGSPPSDVAYPGTRGKVIFRNHVWYIGAALGTNELIFAQLGTSSPISINISSTVIFNIPIIYHDGQNYKMIVIKETLFPYTISTQGVFIDGETIVAQSAFVPGYAALNEALDYDPLTGRLTVTSPCPGGGSAYVDGNSSYIRAFRYAFSPSNYNVRFYEYTATNLAGPWVEGADYGDIFILNSTPTRNFFVSDYFANWESRGGMFLYDENGFNLKDNSTLINTMANLILTYSNNLLAVTMFVSVVDEIDILWWNILRKAYFPSTYATLKDTLCAVVCQGTTGEVVKAWDGATNKYYIVNRLGNGNITVSNPYDNFIQYPG